MKVFLLFDAANETAMKNAQKSKALIEAEGFESCASGEDEKALLDEARFILFIADSDSDLKSVELSDKWRYFQNEIRWKRKKCGDVILLTSPDVDLSRLPFALRECKRITYGEINGLVPLIMSYAADIRPVSGGAVPRAPIPASKESVTKRVDNGCKDDHVFDRSSKEKPQVNRANRPQAKPPVPPAQKPAAPVQKPPGQNANQTGAQNQPNRPQSAPQQNNQNAPGRNDTDTPRYTPGQTFGSGKITLPDMENDDHFTPHKPPGDNNMSENKKIGCVLIFLFAAFFLFFAIILPNVV